MNYKFLLRTDQRLNGTVPLYCRGTINRKKKDISLKIYLTESQFDPVKQIIINHPDKVSLNLMIDKIRFRVNQEVYNCQLFENEFTMELFEQLVKGKVANRNSFFDFAWNEINSSEFSHDTMRTYKSQLTKLKQFREEILWKDLTIDFIEKYRSYMLHTLNNNENTCYKSLSIIKTIVNQAIKKGIVKENALKDVPFRKIASKREFLDIDELKVLEDLYYAGKLAKHKQNVLQYFLFSCYTGLRYMDIKNIRHGDIKKNIIQITMHKTKDFVRIPLIEKAKILIKSGESGEKIFKVISNQKTNEFLKDIMQTAEISKTISFHCSRHTFATIGLTVGIPIEVISKLLGHRDMKTTQIYAKVIDTLKIKEMEKWNKM